jgi:hypothetical protein
MKTFRWTVPEFPLSAAEKRNARKMLRQEPEKLNDLLEPKSMMERWALNGLNQQYTLDVWVRMVVGLVLMLLYILLTSVSRWEFTVSALLLALVVANMLSNHFTRKMLLRLKRRLEQAEGQGRED